MPDVELDVLQERTVGSATVDPMSDTRLTDLQQVWEAHAQADPLWAILSEDSRRRRGWDLDGFMLTGQKFVRYVLSRFEESGHRPTGAVLDFGCGVGRLTQPLADRFESAIGVDISPTMIKAALRLNQHGDRVTYVVNDEPNLSFVPTQSLDMVMSFITLQHVPPAASRSYLAEFVRILRPGGLLFFQLPSHRNADHVEFSSDAPELSPEHCRARLQVAEVPSVMGAGTTAVVTVTVQNQSSIPWVSLAEHPLRVGNHWARDGKTVVHDDGRSALPSRLESGSTATTYLSVTAPSAPGSYELIFDVVQEGSRWFGDAGSQPVTVPVTVLSGTDGDAELEDRSPAGHSTATTDPLVGLLAPEWHEPAAFEMHGIPRAEIEELLDGFGARILGVDEHVDDWVSYAYFVVMS